MNVPTPVVSKVDLQGLIDAIAQASADDSMTNPLTQAQWDILSSYLLPVVMPAGQVLFTQGATDRTLYLVESGSLSVHYQDEKERLRLAIVGAGSVVVKEVPPRVTVAGVPARIIGEAGTQQPASVMDQVASVRDMAN